MLNFLEVPDSVRPMLQRSPNNNKQSQQSAGGALNHVTANHSVEETQVLELLHHLRTGQNKVAALRQFEQWYFTVRPRLGAEYVRKLFEGSADSSGGGTTSNQAPVGLVQTCGDFRHSRCASRAALYLISRLLDPEKNKESAMFIDQLASLPASVLQRLRLHMHLLSSRGNRPAGFNILYLLQQYVETHFSSRGSGGFNSSNGNNQNGLTLELLVQDTWARQEYLRWLSVRLACHPHTIQPRNEYTNLGLTALRGNTLQAYKQLVQAGFQQLLQVCSLETGWHDVELTANEQLTSSLHASMSAAADGQQLGGKSGPKHSAVSPPGGVTLPNAPSPPDERLENLNMSLSYQRDAENNMVLMRSCVLLQYSVNEVLSLLTISDLLPLWDEKVHAANVTQQLDPSSDVLHLVFTPNASFYSHKDFCLLRSITQLQDGSAILLYRSVAIPSCGEVKGYHRCMLPPSGFVVSPLSESETLLTLVLQLDEDGVLIYASDLLGESHDLQLTWSNLSCLLAQQRQ